MELEILGMNFSCVLTSLADGKFPHKDCLLPLISKLLGYCIVAASTTVKLPQTYLVCKIAPMAILMCWQMKRLLQHLVKREEASSCVAVLTYCLNEILKILKHNSVRGLSVTSFELEVVGYTIALAYCLHKGLPFSAYGELFFLLIQGIILVAIIYYYSRPAGVKSWIRALLYCGLAPTILAGQIDPVLFEALYASQHAIFIFARVPQIWENYSNKSTGELSFLTCFMNFGGSLVRVFTSIQENAPISVILGSVFGIVMNGAILSQILFYQKSEVKKEKKKQ